MPPLAPLEFFFDFVSPNAYVAWTQIHEVAGRHGRAVRYMPVLFAGLLGHHGRLGPAEVRPMARWMARNCLRKASTLRVPLKRPHSHPFNSLLTLRVASLPLPDEQRRSLIDALFLATWGEGRNVSHPLEVERIATSVGLDGPETVRQATREETKRGLRVATESALARGVFGVPTVLIGEELFWGYDDFPYLERFLAGEDPLPREELARWAGLSASATRRELREKKGEP